ncbi:PhoH family protein [Glycomyces artemisiae]|uniref:PhoH-like protein n=1 Tax=Glycomyces artemisiae TaxID=1076443 RepID=A0A2T0UJ33_9ACTN|nr:PhoH family protein [Glycomyces artemisiae]PRY57945.1 phosphate starvation-inducible protein PhoH [Glycomyces artemisiae]
MTDRSDNVNNSSTITSTITVGDQSALMALLGRADENLRYIERRFPGVDLHVRGDTITLTGINGAPRAAERLVKELLALIENGENVDPDIIRRTENMLKSAPGERPVDVLTQNIVSKRGKAIRPKTIGQKRYVEAIDDNTIVFGIGPAGTGKTYLAMAKAVQALQAKEISRIILTRPAVEAGERLGFLPGTLFEKIDPYLRPLYDALHDMIDPGSIPKLMESGTIEVAPLAFMRGRAHAVFTNVLTPDGWREIGDLEVGDLVVGSNGEPTPVLGVYPQGKKEMYRVTAQDGASVLACAEHLWAVKTAADKRRGKPHRILETQEMIDDLRVHHQRKYELPLVSKPVEFPEREVPMDPYALGLLLGDGCLTGTTTPSFSTADPELAEALEAALPGVQVRHKSGPDYVLNRVASSGDVVTIVNPVTKALRELELLGTMSHNKDIPEIYRFNSSATRLALLQGLLDSDGGPVVQSGRTCRIQYTTTSIVLRDHVTELVQSLGGIAYSRRRPADGRKPGSARGRDVEHRQDAHIIDIRLPEGIEPFRLERKAAKYRATGGGRPMRFIDSIEYAGEEEAVCIQVAAEDSLYVTEDYLVTHNTLNDAFIILDEAQNTTPEQMKMFLTRLGFGSKIVVTGDVTQVDLPGGTTSGLRVVRDILEGVEDVHFATLRAEDVVRHQLVSDIVNAYEKWDAAKDGHRAPAGKGHRGNRGHRDHQ